MKKRTFTKYLDKFALFLFLFVLISCSGNPKTESEAADSAAEPSETTEWISLFDGQTLNGWKRYNADHIGNLWKIEDGTIVCYSEGGGEATAEGGSLITVEQFDNFELSLEWKLSPGGNSGLMYHVVEGPDYTHAYVTGPEYQLLDDLGVADPGPARSVAANYDMYAPAADKPVKPAGEWNSTRIIYDNGRVEHWLNGQKVLTFTEGSAEWKDRYEKSKWKEYPAWCSYKKGSIALQDHGTHTWFRNIRIRKL